jgi:hypothetical protein
MEKIMMVFFKNVFKTFLSKCIQMQDLHEIFFNSNIFLITFIFYVCTVSKILQNED